ncbi:MAG: N,N-dimethylformamidase beta subunit family domain-containing protein [Catenulispora sp.]
MRLPDGFTPVADPVGTAPDVPDIRDDAAAPVKGFASDTGVSPGAAIDFHISVARPRNVTVEIYRVGAYGDQRTALLGVSEPIAAGTQPEPVIDAGTGLITCPWEASWRLNVPADWKSGAYLAVLRTEDGANHVPFVVRSPRRRATWLVVVPFACYQAYNMYPFDGARGKNLYYGFDETGEQSSKLRASSVSFQRPYELTGLPREAERVHDFVVWAERQGYDLEYATSADLDAGRVDPLAHKGLIFPGHDEYWSAGMRRTLVRTLDSGVSAVFLQANNVYWHIRYEGSTITCHKSRQDPVRTKRPGQTVMWRDLRLPEQELLGAQYVSVVKDDAPLVVANADHWFWQAAGVGAGEAFPGLVGGEADSVQDKYQQADSTEFTILARSPYTDGAGGDRVQNTVLHRKPSGAWVFDAGTFYWPMALGRDGFVDPRIEAATAALLARIAAGDGLASRSARRRAALAAALKREASPAAVSAKAKPVVKRVGRKVKHTLKRS